MRISIGLEPLTMNAHTTGPWAAAIGSAAARTVASVQSSRCVTGAFSVTSAGRHRARHLRARLKSPLNPLTCGDEVNHESKRSRGIRPRSRRKPETSPQPSQGCDVSRTTQPRGFGRAARHRRAARPPAICTFPGNEPNRSRWIRPRSRRKPKRRARHLSFETWGRRATRAREHRTGAVHLAREHDQVDTGSPRARSRRGRAHSRLCMVLLSSCSSSAIVSVLPLRLQCLVHTELL